MQGIISIEADDYRELKSEYNAKLEKLKAQLSNDEDKHVDLKALLGKGIETLLQLDYIYESGDAEKRQQVISSMFPEKLHF